MEKCPGQPWAGVQGALSLAVTAEGGLEELVEGQGCRLTDKMAGELVAGMGSLFFGLLDMGPTDTTNITGYCSSL